MTTMFVYVTAASVEEASTIGRAIVDARLAACANVLNGMISIYRWQGALAEEREAVLILKTVEERLPALIDTVKALHSYELPCVVALPVAAGNPAYLDWIAGEVA